MEDYLNGAYYAVEALAGPQIYDEAVAAALPGANAKHPVVRTRRYGRGRVFVLGIGHVGAPTVPDALRSLEEGCDIGVTVDDPTCMPQFKALLVRGTEWAATGTVFSTPAPADPL